ncbi:MAG: hypothetical protein NZ531_03255 [Aquificaceae bacterium]|nr:hypothetical protein [Aquificaceae bacterium]
MRQVKKKASFLVSLTLPSLLFFSLAVFPQQNRQTHEVKVGKYLTIKVINGEIKWQVEGSPYGWFNVYSQGAGNLNFFGALNQMLFPLPLPQWLSLTASVEVLFSFQVEPLLDEMPENFGFITFGDVWVGVGMMGQQSLPPYAWGSIQTVPSLQVWVFPTESVLVAETLEGEIWFHWGETRAREGEIVQEEMSSSFDHEVRLSGETNLDLSAGVNEIDSAGGGVLKTGIVILSGVDPLGVPEVGDNEFVWSSEEPPWLKIPAGAEVVSGFTPDNGTMQWLAERVDWDVSPSLPSTGLYVRVLPNGCEDTFIFPRNRYRDEYIEEPRLRYFLIFDMPEYLPATIGGGFGKRQLVMTFNEQTVHNANIEIFFPATATNHPFLFGDEGSGNPPDEGDYIMFIGNKTLRLWSQKSPNWFYYYWIVAYWTHSEIRLAVNVPGGWYEDGKPYVYVGNNAYLTYNGMRLFRIQVRPSYTTGIVMPFITYGDSLTIKGIHYFIYTVEHELAHKRHYETGIYPSTPDIDGDRLSDDWESDHFLDPFSFDTTDYYNRFGDTTPGDLQCIADIEAYGKLLQKKELWREDWADTGLQKGTPPPSDEFPWKYSSTGKNYSQYQDLLITIP